MPGINNRRFKFVAYLIKIPKEQMKNLWVLREFGAYGSIAAQTRLAISNYLQAKEKEIGCPIVDIQEAREKHARESKE